MTPETNHDVEISIFHDFLEDQGLIVDREEEEQDQWINHSKKNNVGGVGSKSCVGVRFMSDIDSLIRFEDGSEVGSIYGQKVGILTNGFRVGGGDGRSGSVGG